MAMAVGASLSFGSTALDAGEASAGALLNNADRMNVREPEGFRLAMELYEKGLYRRAAVMFGDIAGQTGDMEAAGYSVLCSIKLRSPECVAVMEEYIARYPYSGLIPQIRYAYASNLFDDGDYDSALKILEKLSKSQLYRKQVTEFLFRKAYCSYGTGDYGLAMIRFKEVEARPFSDYTAPSRYSLGYINYLQGHFREAIPWFGKSSTDGRFTQNANYYIFECRFMDKDYKYVTTYGPGMLDFIPKGRRPQLIRMISESFLVLGDAAQARRFYDMNTDEDTPKGREDFFYAGSLLYAVKDWQGAIDQFSMMTERNDSIGQVANYNLGYSYIKTRNKVAAMGAFRDAASVDFDPAMAKDAYFNYAKLVFDLNSDASAFNDYLKRYPDTKRGDRIYSYMAMAALYNRDYEGAVSAYDNIDDLDSDMKSNYMKANYLRANQLVADGAWRGAVPYLKAAAYYSDRRGMFNQLSRFWLAESYYRDNRYRDALALYTELYNISALYGMPESWLIPYGIAWCHFQEGQYPLADKWFTEYLDGQETVFRKEALLRTGDCRFIQKDYAGAVTAYEAVIKDYYDVNDIYPYYQAAMSYGLSGNDARKISLLSGAWEADPASAFYPEAMYELGRAYVKTGNDTKAIDCFNDIIGKVKDNTFVARATLELGMVYRNRSEMNRALGYYKTVVEQMPLSGYADDALLAVESIYQSMNDPDGYLTYIDRIGKGGIKTDEEKENMIFNAAEQIFLSGNYEKALVSLQSYMDRYPAGKGLAQAQFYMAESYKAMGQLEKAADRYAEAMKKGEGSFAEIATLNFAELSYRLHKYGDAFDGYSHLLEIARMDSNIYTATLGLMRSAYFGRNYSAAVEWAEKAAADARSSAAVVTESDYIRAKSLLATSRRDEALSVFGRLAGNPATSYGAEAAYIMITASYDEGLFEDVENKVYDFADKAGDQQYWLAKAFVVLGDSFVDRKDYEQAKATFESILSGYTPDKEDDVHDNVRMRLSRLDEMMKETSDADGEL